jgi:prophage antirepressor-like protein
MTAELKKFEARDSGFRQFCDRYELVANDPKIRKKFDNWVKENMRQQGIINTAFSDGEKKTKVELLPKIAEKDAKIAEKDAKIAEKDAEIAEKDAKIAEKDAEIAALKAKLAK